MGNKDGPLRALFAALLWRLFRPLEAYTSQLLYLFLFAVALVFGARQLWLRYSDHVLDRDCYLLTADKIELAFTPPWIQTDIAQRAVEEGSLQGLNLAQADLAARVADAFALHPWVLKVNRISKKYDRIVVALEYRRPVAMVWVKDQFGNPALFPIDASGIVLPTEDFRDNSTSDKQLPTAQYLHIEVRGDEVWPADPIAGSRWGDERIHGAARLAAALLDTWQPLGLERIIVTTVEQTDGSTAPPVYQLLARSGATIHWGSAPGQEASGEPLPQQKIARLLQLVEQHGTLPSSPQIQLGAPSTPSIATRPHSL